MGPGYWLNEQSGELKPAVERYLHGEPISLRDIALLRAYIRQWIMSPVWDANPHAHKADDLEDLQKLREMVNSLVSRKQLDLWTEKAVDSGLDPW